VGQCVSFHHVSLFFHGVCDHISHSHYRRRRNPLVEVGEGNPFVEDRDHLSADDKSLLFVHYSLCRILHTEHTRDYPSISFLAAVAVAADMGRLGTLGFEGLNIAASAEVGSGTVAAAQTMVNWMSSAGEKV
jgi:hypothetical protein